MRMPSSNLHASGGGFSGPNLYAQVTAGPVRAFGMSGAAETQAFLRAELDLLHEVIKEGMGSRCWLRHFRGRRGLCA
jgi:hypothetical protein